MYEFIYPATAPLPSLPTFLGSPFNTRSRGAYLYQASPTLHKLGSPGFDDDWAGSTEWIEDSPQAGVAIAEADYGDCLPSPRKRRDTSGSSSSNDDLYSGASSASLPSLGRLSSDNGRPSAIAIWSAEADDHEPGTPSRQLFTAPLPSTALFGREHDVGFEALGKGRAPGGPRTFDRTISDATIVPSPRRSPLANLLPRLRRRSPRYHPDDDTDTEDVGATTWGSPRPRMSMDRAHAHDETDLDDSIEHIGLGLGIGIGIIRSESGLSSLRSPRLSEGHAATLPPVASSSPPAHAPIPQLRRTSSSNTHPQSPVRPRPLLRRGLTDSQLPMFDTPPHLPLFGDAKPSPAAFASTGLIKKKGGSLGLPTFEAGGIAKARSCTTLCQVERAAEPVPDRLESPVSPLSPLSLVSPLKADVGGNGKSRGLRRKGSTLFGAETERAKPSSPATPTKPGLPTFRVGVHTPSPPHTSAYPFAPSTLTPTHTATPASMPRIRELANAHGPLIRTSNPMLSASYRADANADGPTRSADSGNRLERDFEIVRALGQGEFSRVWEVRDKKQGNVWAVKAGKPYTGFKNRLRQLEEVSILRHLSLSPHPNVVTYVDSWEHASRLHIQLELLSCGDLSRFLCALSDCGGLGEARVWKTVVELSAALRHIHTHGFVHLDLKPSNVLITPDGALKVSDFGMSMLLLAPSADGTGAGAGGLSPALPQSGPDGGFVWAATAAVEKSPLVDREFEGDREYLCPEALGEQQPGAPADVFSLGILVLEAALNVVLPPNGDGWVKLRNDDFSDLAMHYVVRDTRAKAAAAAATPATAVPATDTNAVADTDVLPVVSDELMALIRDMMRSDPEARATLEEVRERAVVRRVEDAMGAGESEQWRAGPALVDEPDEFLAWALGSD
ncbi:mitosis inhibitor protein kinase swe1 [Cryptotrichosporon argae]